MKPPPPMFPALGCVTASANAVATAASTALPPLSRILAPASHAGADVQTTRPFVDGTPGSGAARGAATTSITSAADSRHRLSMGTDNHSLVASTNVGAEKMRDAVARDLSNITAVLPVGLRSYHFQSGY